MGKYWTLGGITAILLGALWLLPMWMTSILPQVSLIQSKQVDYTPYYLVSGTAEEEEKTMVLLELPVVPKHVAVRPGDTIKAGDLIATVDREATMEAVASLASRYLGQFSDGLMAVLGSVGQNDLLSAELLPEKIYSTASGIVRNVSLHSGELALPQTAAVTLSGSDRLRARFFIPESQMKQVQEGMEMTFTAAGAGETRYRAVVREVGASAVSKLSGLSYQTGVEVLADIEGDLSELKAGYTLNGEFVSGETAHLSVLPYEAIGQDENGEYVWIWENGYARRQSVETGQELSTSVDVCSGITPESLIIYPCRAVSAQGPVQLLP